MHISLAADKVFELGGLPITNTMITVWVVMAMVLVGAYLVGRNIQSVPRGMQNVAELILEGLYNYYNSVFQDKKKTKKYFALLTSFFLIIVIGNWTGILIELFPIYVQAPLAHKSHEVHLLRGINTDLNVTLSWALISVGLVQFFGVSSLGFFNYFSKFINLKGPIDFFVGIIEIISELSRIVTFSFRLFGNILGGGIVLLIISEMTSSFKVSGVNLPLFGTPIPFYGLELFVGFIQALIFTTLTLVFIKMATEEHH
ncbi:MAG: F0F1 ATP synthase subunit A [Candidatus Moranbacteria bacterium]|nr:F0F1 ATP synthase subunit A [Candidatus Moranbacteria bacterium]